MLASSIISASRESAPCIRSRLGISGGRRSDRVGGSRERNFAKTWLAIDACPGMMLRVPAAPEVTLASGTSRRPDRRTFYGIQHSPTFALGVDQVTPQLLCVFFGACFVALSLQGPGHVGKMVKCTKRLTWIRRTGWVIAAHTSGFKGERC